MGTSEADSTSLEPADVYWTSFLTWTLSCFSLPPTFNTLREFALFILEIKQQHHNVLESMATQAWGRRDYPAFLGLISSISTPLSFRTSFSLLLRIDSLSLVKEPLRFRLLSPSCPELASSAPDQVGRPSPGPETGSTWSCGLLPPEGQGPDQTIATALYLLLSQTPSRVLG